ncbi:MspA family porin [Nocardia pseudobrasiliensis]|uniref:MspA protein n=1 Tax=Nocardia pseudobrasiliensis TaxID=45979 RepID=A0A370I0A1_9NOCA|nr:MspA family porin [Nocardia pseudobrasiliensis]RDI64175.1 MspA protein [Nocardia pseudobrasiliensis]
MIRTTAVTAIAVTVGLGLCSPGVANADTFIPLPGGTITRTLGDGTEVTVSIQGESAKISGSMGATPLHRNVWTTGRGVVDVAGGKSGSASVKIYPGYVVGCQVSVSGLTSGENESGSVDPSKAGGSNPLAALGGNVGGTETLVLAPGQAAARYLLDIEKPNDFGNDSHKRYHQVTGPHASVSWTDETFALDGCAGYAQARTFVTADVATDNTESMITVWGEPFSMG